MKKTILTLIGVVILVSLLPMLLSLHSLSGMPIYIRLIPGILILFFIPGFLFSPLILKTDKFNIFEYIPIWFALSFILFLIPGSISLILKLNCRVPAILMYILTLCLFVIHIIKCPANEFCRQDSQTTDIKKITLIFLCFGLGMLIWILISWSKGLMTGDALNYIAYIRKLCSAQNLLCKEVYYRNINIDTTYGFNIWILMLSVLGRITHLDILEFWFLLPSLLTPVIILAFFTFTRTLFNNIKLALFSTFVFLMFFGINQGMWIFRTAPYPQIIANMIFLPLILTFAFRYFYNGKKCDMWICGCLSLAVATIHLWGLVLAIISITSFALFLLFFKRTSEHTLKRVGTIVLIIFLFASPYLIVKIISGIKIVNPYYLNLWHTISITDNLFIFHPWALSTPHYIIRPTAAEVLQTPRYFYFLAFILTPLLLINIKKNKIHLFLFSNMIVPPLVMLNPLLLPLVTKVVPLCLVEYISQLSPVVLVNSIFMYKIFSIISRKISSMVNIRNKKNVIGFIFSLLLIISTVFVASWHRFNRRFVNFINKENKQLPYYFEKKEYYFPVLNFIREKGIQGETFLTQRQLALFIPAYSDNYVMVLHPGHASPAAGDQYQRMEDADNFFNSSITVKEAAAILEKYGVSYIIWDKNRHPEWPLEIKNSLKKVFETKKLILYCVQ